VEQAKAGDLDAFERLVVLHQRAALQVAYVIAGPDAEDAAQEGFVKAFRALGRFRSGSPFRPWLLRIVANEARNHRRSAARRACGWRSVRPAARPSSARRRRRCSVR
jgi:RNA polymerase sigma factor (sigma-70 family)